MGPGKNFSENIVGTIRHSESLVEIYGHNRVLIEWHRGVTCYSTTEVLVKIHKGCICVRGTDLNMRRLSKEKLVITGNIFAVQLKRNVAYEAD